MSTASSLQTTVGALTVLLLEEIEAGEIYESVNQAVRSRRLGTWTVMRSILQDHDRNACMLREEIRRLGGDSVSVANACGRSFPGAYLEGTAILAALQATEERALRTANRILRMADADTRSLLRGTVISSLHRHLAEIDRMGSRLRATRPGSTRDPGELDSVAFSLS